MIYTDRIIDRINDIVYYMLISLTVSMFLNNQRTGPEFETPSRPSRLPRSSWRLRYY